MNNKKEGYKFTQLEPIEEKVEKTETPEAKKLIEGEKPSPSAAERIKIMQQHRLKEDMVMVGGEIRYSDWEDFDDILKNYKKEDRYKEPKERAGWTQKKLAAHYILEGIKRDLKKFSIDKK